MSKAKVWWVAVILMATYVAHVDFGLGHITDRYWGIPISLWYHIAYCALVMAVMAWLVKYAWPLSDEDES